MRSLMKKRKVERRKMNIKSTDPLQAVQELRAELVAIHPCLKNYPVNDTQALVDLVVPFVIEKESVARRGGYQAGLQVTRGDIAQLKQEHGDAHKIGYAEGERAMREELLALVIEGRCPCGILARAWKDSVIGHFSSACPFSPARALPVSGTDTFRSLIADSDILARGHWEDGEFIVDKVIADRVSLEAIK